MMNLLVLLLAIGALLTSIKAEDFDSGLWELNLLTDAVKDGAVCLDGKDLINNLKITLITLITLIIIQLP